MINNIVRSSDKDNEYIHAKLCEYNGKYMKDFHEYNFHIEDNGKIIAGIVANSTIDTLEVDFLFVDENHRGKNLGSKLLKYAEDEARSNGLKRVLLNTYSFQAPEFYKKLGYEEILKINPCFEQFSQSYFLKNL